MKYTIELTEAERDIICSLIRGIRDNSLGDYKLFDNTTIFKFDEESTDYSVAYLRGFEDGKADASYQKYYDKGYNKAINDYNMMIEWMHGCDKDFVKFLFEVYGLSSCRGGIDLLYDLICSYDIAEVISEFKKWQEEKKKAEEIKVGDIIYSEMTDTKAIIISFDAWDNWNCIDTCGTGFVIHEDKMRFWKKIGHIDEVEQLLSKLRGE